MANLRSGPSVCETAGDEDRFARRHRDIADGSEILSEITMTNLGVGILLKTANQSHKTTGIDRNIPG